MNYQTRHVVSLAVLLTLVGLCRGQDAADEPSEPKTAPHAHPTEGPHGGHLIELGKEEYHAELIHDDATGKVTVFLLDGSVNLPVAIEQPQITINIRHDGEGKQFKLLAVPAAKDAAGSSSRFRIESPELTSCLGLETLQGMLVVKIAGKQYVGKLEHHAHGDEEERIANRE